MIAKGAEPHHGVRQPSRTQSRFSLDKTMSSKAYCGPVFLRGKIFDHEGSYTIQRLTAVSLGAIFHDACVIARI